MAAEKLTKEEKEKLQRRQEKVQPRRGSTTSSRGEGTSRQKGKNVDPREWGNVDFSRETFDIDAQIAALKAFKAQAKAQRRSQGKKPSEKADYQTRNDTEDRKSVV